MDGDLTYSSLRWNSLAARLLEKKQDKQPRQNN